MTNKNMPKANANVIILDEQGFTFGKVNSQQEYETLKEVFIELPDDQGMRIQEFIEEKVFFAELPDEAIIYDLKKKEIII
jgi:hypothetical protein